MEIDNFHESDKKAQIGSEHEESIINVWAIISCPICNYKKKFKNQFPRKELELFKVTISVFDWLTCDQCGELLNLNLEFQI